MIFSAWIFFVDPSFEIEFVLVGFSVLIKLAVLTYREEDLLFIKGWSSGYFRIFAFIFLDGIFPITRLDFDAYMRLISSPPQFAFNDKFSVYLLACFKTAILFLLETFLATLALVVTAVLGTSVVLFILHESCKEALSRYSFNFFECLVMFDINDTFCYFVTYRGVGVVLRADFGSFDTVVVDICATCL